MKPHSRILIILLTLSLKSIQLSLAKSRNSTSKNPKPFDSAFPFHLTTDFSRCRSIADEGQKGVCKIISAMDTQLHLLPSEEISTTPTPPPPSCEFKRQNGRSFHRYATPISPELNTILDRYTRMHRACLHADQGSLKRSFLNRKLNQFQLKCRYIVWSCTFGLGNKIMSLISTFLYAIISQRVLLLDESPNWDKLFCQPFEHSDWRLPPGLTLKDDQSMRFQEFLTRCSKNPEFCKRFMIQISFSANSKPEDHRFLVCPWAFSSVRDVPVLHFDNSNQYFATGFFLNPVLQPVLGTIFPERKVFNNLAGFLLSPSDEVWGSISDIYSRTYQNATSRIGVQLRESKGEYREYYDSSVPRCIRWNSGLCPIEIEEFQESELKDLSKGYYSVYVSSLVGEHSSRINASLRGVERETGQRFELGSQVADGEQMDDVEHQRKALADMWMLSMADVLMTSHMSTFGYTAQGLAGLTPYLLKPWEGDPCWLGVSSEPCFHFAPSGSLSCGKQDGGVERVVGDVYTPCPDFRKTGIQLLER